MAAAGPELRGSVIEQGLVLVEDCALALLSEAEGGPLGSFGDYAVFCLYKTLPVLDGGLLVQHRHPFSELERLPLRRIGRAFEVGQALELWLERARSRAPRLGGSACGSQATDRRAADRSAREARAGGRCGFNVADADIAMSCLVRTAARPPRLCGDPESTPPQFLAPGRAPGGIRYCAVARLEDGVCPLFFPLLVKDKPGPPAS